MVKEELITLSLPYPNRGNKTVRVYVPAHEEGEKLPVVYMTDGQNLFEDTAVQFGCWYTREAVREEFEKSGKAAIIVGIHNDGDPMERENDLLAKNVGALDYPPDMPDEVKAMFKPSGEVFEDFVLNVVMPEVEEKFPVKKGWENTAFCGSSMGGLQTFYMVMNNPDTFCMGGVFSPAFVLYVRDDLEKWVREKASAKGEKPFVYLYCGKGDPMEQQFSMGMEFVYGILGECYQNDKIKNVVIPECKHHETAWEPIFKDFLHIFLQK